MNPSEELAVGQIELVDAKKDLAALTKENAKLEMRVANGIAGSAGVRATVLEAAKAFTVLNSAGVAAMLAMTQALIVKDSFGPFKWFAIAILSSFLIGAVSACLTFLVHTESALIALIEDTPAPAIAGVMWCIRASIFFFILGAALMVCGVATRY
ncbi:hypothetical protein [Massilia soli]|uniref:Uncharacterized protein n=1 Tax=Massilia soli TaxID=2792854 RepID=A0ABS7SLL3_9BURK|nr:hypothetical protein [Massilia soli]MBZ2206582.1 hypothetical protein [Massilia soli]